MKILVIASLANSLINFRGPLLKEMDKAGHVVVACANGKVDSVSRELKKYNVLYIPIKISRAGLNPVCDIITLYQLLSIIRKHRPDMVLAYTIKPVIWGGIAAKLSGIKNWNALITGLGYAFINNKSLKEKIINYIASSLYRLSLAGAGKVIFQNKDDCREFVSRGIISFDKGVIVNGSGVDLKKYHASNNRNGLSNSQKTTFLLIARLLLDKGVKEYIDAAHKLKTKHPEATFLLAGPFDSNPSSIKEETLKGWIQNGSVEFLGELEDVKPAYRKCTVFVLPSYREGTPRTVLEAMAVGRPIITTDTPGCRETILNGKAIANSKIMAGKNGFLVPVGDAEALAEAMEHFILFPNSIEPMGKASLDYVKKRYDVKDVNRSILKHIGL